MKHYTWVIAGLWSAIGCDAGEVDSGHGNEDTEAMSDSSGAPLPSPSLPSCLDGDGGAVHLVDLLTATDDSTALDFAASEMQRLESHDAQLVHGPIRVGGQLDSPALPDSVQTLPGDWMLISKHASCEALESYLEREEVALAHTEWLNDERERVRFVARTGSPLPDVPLPFPDLGDATLRPDPAFLLLNGISMAPGEEAQDEIAEFFGQAAPRNLMAGTQFFSAFLVSEPLEGDFDFDLLFITEWSDPAAFDQVHFDPAFVDLAQSLRNPNFTRFTEQAGQVKTR